MKLRLLALTAAMLLVSACAGPSGPGSVETKGVPLGDTKVTVLEFSQEGAAIRFNAPHDTFGLMVAEEIAAGLRASGHDAEAVPAGARPASGTVVTGRVTRIDAGSRALRYMVGFGAGAAKFGIEGKVVDAGGKELGTFSHERWSGFGIFGGNSVSLVQKCLRTVGLDVAKMIDTGVYTRASG